MLAEIFGPDLLIVVLVVVVVLFGGAAIPKLARNLGSAKKEFEKGIKEGSGDQVESGPAAGDPATGGPATGGPVIGGPSGNGTPAVQHGQDVPQNPPTGTSSA